MDLTPPLLDVCGLQTLFETRAGTIRAVDDISFSLYRGETLGIVGESGCGKSVTALSLMRLIPSPPGTIAGGQVVFDGRDVLALPPRAMRRLRGSRMAMIFQDPLTALNPVLTIGRQATESLTVHTRMSRRQAGERIVSLLSMLGFPNAAHRLHDYPHQLSGGMRQRVMIAIALSCRPELLIADEPTTSLDVTIQAQILERLNEIKREVGTAMILITHNLGIVAGMADRILVMYAGRIVEEGPTRELFANPRMPYTIGLLRSLPRLDATGRSHLAPIRGHPPDLIGLSHECPFYPRCDYGQPDCLRQRPPLRPVGPAHRAACLFDITIDTPLPSPPVT